METAANEQVQISGRSLVPTLQLARNVRLHDHREYRARSWADFLRFARERRVEPVYRGDFIEHYVVPLLYPARLTTRMQFIFGTAAVAVNALAYALVLRRRRVRE